MIAWVPFREPLVLSFYHELWFLLPLCAAVGIVYKTIRIQHLRHLLREIVFLMVYMLAGLTGLAVVLWLIHEYWP